MALGTEAHWLLTLSPESKPASSPCTLLDVFSSKLPRQSSHWFQVIKMQTCELRLSTFIARLAKQQQCVEQSLHTRLLAAASKFQQLRPWFALNLLSHPGRLYSA